MNFSHANQTSGASAAMNFSRANQSTPTTG